MKTSRTLVEALLAALLAGFVAGGAPAARAARAEDPVSPAEAARRENVERLEKDVRRWATSPRAAEKKAEIRKGVEALGALGGVEAAKGALGALALDDVDVEKDVMKVVETEHAKALVAPLAAMIDGKDTRRRFRLLALVGHALGVMADPSALEPLAHLVQSEDAGVVAAAADALVNYRTAPHAKRLEPVRRLIDVFETTWNYKESHRPEDKIRQDQAKTDWEVYGAAVRKALQALTGQSQLTRPKQFRDWWNDHKKDIDW